MVPDVYIEPHLVWEIKCADLTLSSVHTGARGQAVTRVEIERDKLPFTVEESRSLGIGLRFPRFVRGRFDKLASQATSSFTMGEMYRA